MLRWSNISTRGSEHYLEGQQQPAEIQLFHWNTNYSSYEEALGNSDGIAALSFFYEVVPTSDPRMENFFTAAKTLDSTVANMGLEFEEIAEDLTLDQLLPIGGVGLMDNYYYYDGSVTQPSNSSTAVVELTTLNPADSRQSTTSDGDCTEQVLWIAYEKKIQISETQLEILRSLLATVNSEKGQSPACVSNFRPLVALNPISTATALVRKLMINIYNIYISLVQVKHKLGGFSSGSSQRYPQK